MTRDETFAFFARRQEAWRHRDVDALVADHAPHGRVVSPMFTTVVGREQIRPTYESLFRVFPDWDLAGESLLVDGARVAQPFSVRATHEGEFMGFAGTGRRFEIQGVLLFEMEGAAIAHERRVYDFTGLLIQLGVLKSKPGR
jgi:predicted ester cyclase